MKRIILINILLNILIVTGLVYLFLLDLRIKDDKIHELEKNFKALTLSDYEKLQIIDKDYKNIIENRLKYHGINRYKQFEDDSFFPLEGDGVIISSEYGSRLLFGKWQFHAGVDLIPLYDLFVYNAEEGVVKNVFYNKVYGLALQVESENYIRTYAHLEKTVVNVGDKVMKGQHIGVVGETGEITGLHLHYSIMKKTEKGLYSMNPFRNTTYKKIVDVTNKKDLF